MRDILDQIGKWWDAGEAFGLATVVQTFSSAPREPGAALAVSADGEVVGSVSGGCVEGAVYELSGEVSATGQAVLQRYGVSDDTAFSVGLDLRRHYRHLRRADQQGQLPGIRRHRRRRSGMRQPVAVATVIAGPGQVGARRIIWPADYEPRVVESLGSGDRLDQAVDDDAQGHARAGPDRRAASTGRTASDGLTTCRCSSSRSRRRPGCWCSARSTSPRPSRRIGKFLGYRVTVCDARPVFATSARFPDADEVVTDWPHRYLAGITTDERTVICVLTHDPKFDVPVLEVALRVPAAYIGAMGSRRTHDDRLDRLREVGMPSRELARLRSPVGLDLGARTPEETAVAIAAELIQLRWGGSGQPLTVPTGASTTRWRPRRASRRR